MIGLLYCPITNFPYNKLSDNNLASELGKTINFKPIKIEEIVIFFLIKTKLVVKMTIMKNELMLR